jgi:hypothetical protein
VTKEEQEKAIQKNADRIDELETELENARRIVNAPKVDPNLLPSDWDAWDVYIPNQVASCPVQNMAHPSSVATKEDSKVDAGPPVAYSKYLQEKNEEYYDKYILD